MKKTLLLIVSTLIWAVSMAQGPVLEGTWYLYNMYSELYYIDTNTVNPPITPSISFNQDYTFNGIGVCNTFEGALEYNPTEDDFTLVSFTATQEDCGIFEHNDFEDVYFDYFSEGGKFFYFIEEDPAGFTSLQLDIPIFAGMRFRNVLLKIDEAEPFQINIHPNPVTDKIFINTNWPLEKIEMYSLEGKLLWSDNRSLNSINVANLVPGVYFITLFSEREVMTKKFIKK